MELVSRNSKAGEPLDRENNSADLACIAWAHVRTGVSISSQNTVEGVYGAHWSAHYSRILHVQKSQ